MGELAKIDSFRKELALAETIEQIKLLGDAALAYQFIIQRQGANKNKIDEIGEFNIEVECKKAEWLDTFYPHGAKPGTNNRDVRYESGTSQMPVTKKESATKKPSGSTRSTRTEAMRSINIRRYQMRTFELCPSQRRRAQQKSRVARHVLRTG